MDAGIKSLHVDKFWKINRFQILITIVFFIFAVYVSFFIDYPSASGDGMFYYLTGKQIIAGEGENVYVPNAPIGGSVIFATVDLIFNDAFFTIKIISLFSSTGIVFFTYTIIRNFFDSKIALLGQIFVAANAKLFFQSYIPLNEILPIFLIFISFCMIIKQNLTKKHVIIAAIVLGISFMIRYQCFPIFIGFLIFLIYYDVKTKRKVPFSLLFFIIFVITCAPLFSYNIMTYDKIVDVNPNYRELQINFESELQSKEFRDELKSNIVGDGNPTGFIFSDINRFLENYFYNLFYLQQNYAFNFEQTIDNISLIPIIPFLSILPLLGGLFYIIKPKLSKKNIIIIIASFVLTLVIIGFTGQIERYFSALIIIPVFTLAVLSFKNIKHNFLPILFSVVTFSVIMSFVTISRADQLLSIWIFFPICYAVFFIEVLPRLISKNHKKNFDLSSKTVKIIVVSIVIIIILMNVGFSYKFTKMVIANDKSYDGIFNEIKKLLQFEKIEPRGSEPTKIGKLLSEQPGISDSYIMGGFPSLAYLSGGKSLYAIYDEGSEGDNIRDFILRENWNEWEIFRSNLNSYPSDRYNVNNPIPDYIIYWKDTEGVEREKYLQILGDPTNKDIPKYLEPIYFSEITGTVVYKIHHEVMNNNN